MATDTILNEVKKVPGNVADSAHKMWLFGLGAVRTTQEEGSRLIDDMISRGRKAEENGSKELDKVVRRVESGAEDVSKEVENRLKGTLRRMGVPTREDILSLTRRVEEISGLVDQLAAERRRAAKQTPTTKQTTTATDIERKVYHVTTHDEGWQVKAEGAERATSVHPTKNEAVAASRELATAQEPSEVIIHRVDGTIQNRNTYGETAEA